MSHLNIEPTLHSPPSPSWFSWFSWLCCRSPAALSPLDATRALRTPPVAPAPFVQASTTTPRLGGVTVGPTGAAQAISCSTLCSSAITLATVSIMIGNQLSAFILIYGKDTVVEIFYVKFSLHVVCIIRGWW